MISFEPCLDDDRYAGRWGWTLLKLVREGDDFRYEEVACGSADSEDLAEQAAESVRRLMEGTCKSST